MARSVIICSVTIARSVTRKCGVGGGERDRGDRDVISGGEFGQGERFVQTQALVTDCATAATDCTNPLAEFGE